MKKELDMDIKSMERLTFPPKPNNDHKEMEDNLESQVILIKNNRSRFYVEIPLNSPYWKAV